MHNRVISLNSIPPQDPYDPRDPTNMWKQIDCVMRFALPPDALSVSNSQLQHSLFLPKHLKYIPEFHGVLVSYKDFKILELEELSWAHAMVFVKVRVNATLFVPKTGDLVPGTVQLVSNDQLGIQVWKTFRAVVRKKPVGAASSAEDVQDGIEVETVAKSQSRSEWEQGSPLRVGGERREVSIVWIFKGQEIGVGTDVMIRVLRVQGTENGLILIEGQIERILEARETLGMDMAMGRNAEDRACVPTEDLLLCGPMFGDALGGLDDTKEEPRRPKDKNKEVSSHKKEEKKKSMESLAHLLPVKKELDMEHQAAEHEAPDSDTKIKKYKKVKKEKKEKHDKKRHRDDESFSDESHSRRHHHQKKAKQ